MEKKIQTVVDLVGQLGFQKKEVKELVQHLSSLYHLSEDDRKAEKVQSTPPPKKGENYTGNTFALEVIYPDNIRGYKEISGKKAVGVIIPGKNWLLYREESGNLFTRQQARAYLSYLPSGYCWHLMKEEEAVLIRNYRNEINTVLKQIGGDVLGSRNYMLDDDGQSKGVVRYVARL